MDTDKKEDWIMGLEFEKDPEKFLEYGKEEEKRKEDIKNQQEALREERNKIYDDAIRESREVSKIRVSMIKEEMDKDGGFVRNDDGGYTVELWFPYEVKAEDGPKKIDKITLKAVNRRKERVIAAEREELFKKDHTLQYINEMIEDKYIQMMADISGDELGEIKTYDYNRLVMGVKAFLAARPFVV